MSHPTKAAKALSALLTPRDNDPPRTQSDLAKALRVSRQAVSRWLSGDGAPALEIALRIEETYGIPVRDWTEQPTEADQC